jgi:hypothetical protein
MRRLASLAVSKSASNPLVAIDVVDEVVDNLKVDENLKKEDLYALVDVFGEVDPNDANRVEFLTLPARNGSAGTLSVLYVDDASAAAVLETLRLGEDATDVSTATTLPVDPTVITVPGVPTTVPGVPTTIAGAQTTTTTSPPLPISDADTFGQPAAVTAPCA